jgi:GT2 family glycosyltransferase
MPYRDLPDETVHQRAPAQPGVLLVHRFRGTAYAVRRELFLRVGGFRPMLYHQAEEADFCLRLLETGYVVRLGRSERISHFASPKRDLDRIWFYECRNDVLFAWHNVPFPDLLAQLGRTTAHMLRLGRGVRRTRLLGRGLLTGFRDARHDRRGRRPVARSVWRLYSQLGNRSTRLEQIVPLLPKGEI